MFLCDGSKAGDERSSFSTLGKSLHTGGTPRKIPLSPRNFEPPRVWLRPGSPPAQSWTHLRHMRTITKATTTEGRENKRVATWSVWTGFKPGKEE